MMIHSRVRMFCEDERFRSIAKQDFLASGLTEIRVLGGSSSGLT